MSALIEGMAGQDWPMTVDEIHAALARLDQMDTELKDALAERLAAGYRQREITQQGTIRVDGMEYCSISFVGLAAGTAVFVRPIDGGCNAEVLVGKRQEPIVASLISHQPRAMA